MSRESADPARATMYLSLVIPAYNEEHRIADTLRSVTAYLGRQSYASEVIVVDDGSRDATAAIVKDQFPDTKLESYRPNRGKGYAVKRGMTIAQGAYRVFYDADASTPIEEVEKLWPRFEDGADVVIGSRSLPDSDVEVPQAWHRRQMGRVFNLVVKVCGLTSFPDTQCGFKGFSEAACEVVFPRQTLDHFSFDAELLFIAQKHGLRVEEVPVRWLNSPNTRVNALSDSSRMFLDLLRIRWKDFRGAYG